MTYFHQLFRTIDGVLMKVRHRRSKLGQRRRMLRSPPKPKDLARFVNNKVDHVSYCNWGALYLSISQQCLNYIVVSKVVSYKRTRNKRAATARPERIWDFAVIPYEIDSNFSGVRR